MVKKKYRIKIRKLWRINPKTKIKESAKVYKRSKQKAILKQWLDEEI